MKDRQIEDKKVAGSVPQHEMDFDSVSFFLCALCG